MTARYAFVFLVYIAVAEVARTRDHIRIDFVPRLLGAKGRLILYAYFDLLYLLLAGLVIYYSLQVIGLSIEYGTPMTGFDVNMAFAQAALPVGWSLACLSGGAVVRPHLEELSEGRESSFGRRRGK